MIRTHFRDKAGNEVSRAEEQRAGGQVVQPWGESGGVDLQIQNTKYKIQNIKTTPGQEWGVDLGQGGD